MRKLTRKQKAFADKILEGKTQVQSAMEVYDIGGKHGQRGQYPRKNGTTFEESVANTIGSENVRKPQVIAYLESKSQLAGDTLVELLNKKQAGSVRLGASKEILDRTVGKVTDKIKLEAEIKNITIVSYTDIQLV